MSSHPRPEQGGARAAKKLAQGYWPVLNKSERALALETFDNVGKPRIASTDFTIDECE